MATDGSSAPIDIRTYRLDRAAFEPVTKRRIFRRMAWAVPMIAGIIAIELYVLGSPDQSGGNVWPLTLVIVVAAVGLGLFLSVRRQLKAGRAQWDSYELTMSDNVLRRQASNLATVEILRPEVTKIVDMRGQGLTVATGDRHLFIFVPEHLVGYAEARGRLSAWKPLEPPKLDRSQAVTVAWTVLLIGSWIGTGLIPDVRLAMISGLVLLLVGGLTIRNVLRMTFADNRTKARMVAVVSFMLVAPFARLALHFVNARLM